MQQFVRRTTARRPTRTGRPGRQMALRPLTAAAGAAAMLALAACQPTVRVEAPREPITINLNVKLDADVRVRLEETARKDITSNPEIF